MDIFTNMFTKRTIVEENKKKCPRSKPTLHETNITKVDLPYAPMKSPKKSAKK